MRTKFIILGLVLIFAGGAMLGGILFEQRKQYLKAVDSELKSDSETVEFLEQYNEWLKMYSEEPMQLPSVLEEYAKGKTETQLWQEQQNRLQADLDELAAGEIEVSPFADFLYGDNWQGELESYKKRKELSEFVITTAIVSISMGGAIFGWYLLLWLLRSIIKGLSRLRKVSLAVRKDGREIRCEEEQLQETDRRESKVEKKSKVTRGSGRRKSKGAEASPSKNKSRSGKSKPRRPKKRLEPDPANDSKKIAVLLSDEKSVDSIARLEGSLIAQTEELEERTSQNIRQAMQEHSQPLDSTLKELAQQVSAIREYASCQQERVEKLQDGYDWNIVRTFCLRIIRCIDNLDNRIERLSGKGDNTEHLEEIKDELIFALESSGIEQYEPEINSDYRGQEKFAEAVKERQHCDKPKQKGKIAKVIRPGYQYFINEDNIKVIRTAQVKLFG